MADLDMADLEFEDADEYVARAEQLVKDAAAKVPRDAIVVAPSAHPVTVFNPAKFIVGKGDATYNNRQQLRAIGCDWIGDKWVAPTELQRIAAVSMCQTFPAGAPSGAVQKLQHLFGIVIQQRGLAGVLQLKPFDTLPDDPESVADISVQIGQALGKGSVVVAPVMQAAAGVVRDPSTAGQAMIPKPAKPAHQKGPPHAPKGMCPVLATDLGDIRQGHLDAIKGVPTEALIYELRRRNVIEAPIETFGEAVEEQIEIPPDLDSAFEFDGAP